MRWTHRRTPNLLIWEGGSDLPSGLHGILNFADFPKEMALLENYVYSVELASWQLPCVRLERVLLSLCRLNRQLYT